MFSRIARRVALAITLFIASFPAIATAQIPQFSLPPQTVVGRSGIGAGPAQAIPFSQLIALMTGGTLSIPSINTNSIVFKGSISGQATVQAQAAAGTPTLVLPNTSGTIPSTATSPIVINPVTGAISCPTCSTSGTAAPILASRAAAQALNLSSLTGLVTAGYTTAGDGGGAIFKNVGSAPFSDTYITTATRAGGSGYTNGTYVDVRLTGGTGKFCNVAATVSGGAVSSISSVTPCVGYSVGDVLTAPNTILGGTGSGFTYTVTVLSAPQASFTDSVGTHWQYVSQGGPANALQFGCKPDWNGVGSDGSSTNNSACLWSALAWAGAINGSTISQAGFGAWVYVPKGAYMTCGAFNGTAYNFVVPQSVRVSGDSIFGTVLAECAADAGTTYYMELCDPNVGSGQFGCKVENMTLYGFQLTAANAGTAMIHSQSGQQFALAENVEVDARLRGCVKYETGIGGAANDVWIGIDCVQAGTATNPGFSFNASTAQHILERSVCASGPAGAAVCIQHTNGRLIASGIDIEGYVIGLQQNVTTGGNISSYKNVQEQSGGCSEAIQLVNTNAANNILIENIATGCPITVLNGPSGVNTTGNILKQVLCPGAGACS